METINVPNLMAKFDFNAPIHVEIIFEDTDDNDSSIQNEQENINDNKNNKQVEINHRGLNKAILSLNKTNRILKEKPIVEINENNAANDLNNSKNAEIRKNKNYAGHNFNQSESAADQHACTLNGNDAVNIEESLPSTRQINDHSEPATTFVEDLLHKLSDHIVLIMQSFYHYGVRNSTQDNEKREKLFHFIKNHFFELSYNTVESIVLPQVQNNSFINNFLDNTVHLANSKSQRWKCQKRHVQPFFKELVTWTKQKREQMKGNHPPCPSNENITLKEQLNRPLRLPFDPPSSGILANSNVTTPKTPNLCIFTSGTPGQEISININADTLLQFTDNQQFTTAERNLDHNNHAPSSESTRRNTPVARPTYGNSVCDIQKINSHNRPPPPSYINHCLKNLPHRPQQYNKKNMNSIRNIRNMNMGLPHQYHQNVAQPMYNYLTQVQYNNTRQMSPSHNDSSNYLLYDSTNNNIPMHETQIEHQTTFSPVITNVTSLNPGPHNLNIRCSMCGKNTSTPCSLYNPSCRQMYCSYLCKELDSQFYKPAWGNT